MKSNLKLLLGAAVVAGMLSGAFATSCGSGGTGGGTGGSGGGSSAGGGTGGGSSAGGGTGGGSSAGGGTGGGTAGGSGGGTAGGSGGGTAGGSGGGTAGGAGGGTAGGAGGGTAGGAGGGTAGGAGGGTAGGAGGGSASVDAGCPAYCNTMLGCGANPDGGVTFSQYPNTAACLGACAAFDAGTSGATSGNSFACREYHAGVAVMSNTNKEMHCPHAGPAGDGVCGTNCESFCQIAKVQCPLTFADAGLNCATACASYTGAATVRYNSSSTSGNTFACRMYHLSVASSSAANNAAHCPHILPGPGPCN